MYSKNNKGPFIDPWGTPQFMVPASEKTLPNETKITLLLDKSETILLSYLKNLCTSFCHKFYDLRCQKLFEDRSKSNLCVSHFQHRLNHVS